MQLELTAEEAGSLREVLQSYVSDLRMEIANTDSKDFRERLKAREVLLDSLIRRLQQ